MSSQNISVHKNRMSSIYSKPMLDDIYFSVVHKEVFIFFSLTIIIENAISLLLYFIIILSLFIESLNAC